MPAPEEAHRERRLPNVFTTASPRDLHTRGPAGLASRTGIKPHVTFPRVLMPSTEDTERERCEGIYNYNSSHVIIPHNKQADPSREEERREEVAAAEFGRLGPR